MDYGWIVIGYFVFMIILIGGLWIPLVMVGDNWSGNNAETPMAIKEKR